jgi:hypothetical protein
MTRTLIATRIRLVNALQNRGDAGQGTMEYVGMLIAVAVIVAAVAGALTKVDLGSKVSSAFTSAFGG